MDYSIFKAYDVRGIYPSQLDENDTKLIGNAFAHFAKSKKIIVGRDMRISSNKIFKKLVQGINDSGVDVIDIGLVSTDTIYYASGKLNLPGIMITASHNPGKYNGFKFCLKKAKPVSEDTGLKKIKELTKEYKVLKNKGKIFKKNILQDYKKFALSFINKKQIKSLKIVIDAGNGMAGKIVPIFFNKLPTKIVPLYFKLDGNFPNHLASPMEKKNLKDLIKKVKTEKADLGMAFDGDADRVFFINEKAKPISGAIITAIIAKNILVKNTNEKIIYDLRCGHIVPETIKGYNGIPIIEKVGHSFIKATMKKNNAIFGGELSGHYYYRDNFYADSGIITALIILEILSKSNQKISQIVKNFQKYYQIEETNFKILDKNKKIKEIKKKYSNGKQFKLDGITVEYNNWWFNVRASNTEPVLRLNLEADTKKLMLEKKKELSQTILKK
ncbi:MAG: phosphomannomutase/phosphoglucomutase [Patescibacteria group bacterium]|nr:phosphomannomutase/phosphoglucomutase [Patescibacteria group bacterium]